jgi:replicative DNA helicase
VSEVVRRLKLMALHLNVCVLTASQLNDKGELRESRGIGHHADYVLHIDHANHPDSEIKLMKNRNGERHVSAPVLMQGGISRFVDRVKTK